MSITPFKALINNTRDNYVYMSTTGDDSNTGEADSPVKSLKRALEIASVNGRGVFVKNGTYNLGDGFGTDPSNRYCYYFSSAGKLYQADQWGNTDLLKSAFCHETPILGEFVPYRELSNPDYTFTKTNDNSNSYFTIQVSPNPNFGIDELKGKILLVNNSDNAGYDSSIFYYRIIKNTADTIYLTSIVSGAVSNIKIYDCPTLQIPSGKTINFNSLRFSFIGLNFGVIGSSSVYGNTDFHSCHFFASTPKYITFGSNSNGNKVVPYLTNCLFNNIYANGYPSYGSAYLSRCAFRGISPAMKNINYVMSCSAWECGDFYQLDYGNFLDIVNIQYAGGRDNTGNFININTSGYKSSNAEIAIQNSIYGDRFTIDVRDIQFANGYKTSLDTIPYQLLARNQVVKLVENEDGLRIWISG